MNKVYQIKFNRENIVNLLNRLTKKNIGYIEAFSTFKKTDPSLNLSDFLYLIIFLEDNGLVEIGYEDFRVPIIEPVILDNKKIFEKVDNLADQKHELSFMINEQLTSEIISALKKFSTSMEINNKISQVINGLRHRETELHLILLAEQGKVKINQYEENGKEILEFISP